MTGTAPLKMAASLIGAVLLLGGATARCAEKDTIHAGQWDYSIEYHITGIPQSFPAYQLSSCLDEEKPIPTITRMGQECSVSHSSRFGNTVSWALDCSSEWEIVQGVGRIHFFPDDTFHGNINLQITGSTFPPRMMMMRLDGKRVGECVKEGSVPQGGLAE